MSRYSFKDVLASLILLAFAAWVIVGVAQDWPCDAQCSEARYGPPDRERPY